MGWTNGLGTFLGRSLRSRGRRWAANRSPHAGAIAASRAALVERLERRQLLSAVPTLVADIGGNQGSSPTVLLSAGALVYFTANDGIAGVELWRSDGTASGTFLLRDIRPGNTSSLSLPTSLAEVNGVVYFAANDGVTGAELWRTNGTTSGTYQVRDINAGGSSNPSYLTNVNGALFFAANDGAGGTELWKSGGTSASTVVVRDIRAGSAASSPSSLSNFQGALVFSANDGVSGAELWKSDGTSSGTSLVRDIRAGSGHSSPGKLTAAGGRLFFTANDGSSGYELWSTDGTSSGTSRVRDIYSGSSGSSPDRLTAVGTSLFFVANDGVAGSELWKSDSVTLSTAMVADLRSGASGSRPANLAVMGGQLYFSANDGATGVQLWKSNGSATGTTRITSFSASGPFTDSSYDSIPSVFPTMVVASQLLFYRYDSTIGAELWKTNGTVSGTVLVRDIVPGPGSSYVLGANSTIHRAVSGGALYFSVETNSIGRELWKSDGTSSGTILVKDINQLPVGSDPMNVAEFDGSLYLSASTPNWSAVDRQLWKVPPGGPPTQVTQSYQFASESAVYGALPSELLTVGDSLYFIGLSGFEFDRYREYSAFRSDGTSSGTSAIHTVNFGVIPSIITSEINVPGRLQQYDGQLLLIGDSNLWRTDGTPAGTEGLLPFGWRNLGGSGVEWNNHLYFAADRIGVEASSELWRTDGTVAGTEQITNQNQFWGAFNLTPTQDALYYVDYTSATGYEVWKLSANSNVPQLVRDINPSTAITAIGPRSLSNLNGTLYFWANDGVHGYELWRSDGTSSGTVMLADLNPGSASARESTLQQRMMVVGDQLYFMAHDGVHGSELWVTDGTSSGTRMVLDLVAGSGSPFTFDLTTTSPISSPIQPTLANVNGTLFFTAYNSSNGQELWSTDGAASGTIMHELGPGPSWAFAANLQVLGDKLYFSANDGVVGQELWSITPPPRASVGAASGYRGESLQISLSAIGGGTTPTDAVTYHIDWNNDGVEDQTLVGPAGGVSVSHAFSVSGAHTVRVRAENAIGVGPSIPATINVTDYVLRPNAANPALTDLIWGGTPGLDGAFFFIGTGASAVTIFKQFDNFAYVNSQTTVTGVTGGVIAYGYDGGDALVAEFVLSQKVQLFGGNGDDVLVGGFQADLLDGGVGNDILLGGTQGVDGADTLLGGTGADLLWGHRGGDSIDGGAGEDLLVADALNFGASLPSAVFAIQSEWLATARSRPERIANISGTGVGPRNNANYFLQSGATVLNDGAVDALLGGTELDWVMLRLAQDVFSDEQPGETKTGT